MAMIIPMVASAVGAIGSGVATVGGAVAGAMGTAASALGGAASAAAGGLGSLASAAGSGLSSLGSAAASGAGKLGALAGQGLAKAGSAISQGLGSLGNYAAQGVSNAGSAIQQGLGSLKGYATEGLSNVGSTISEGVGKVKSVLTGGSSPMDKMPATQNILSGQGTAPSVDMFNPSTWTNNAVQAQDMGINLASTGDPSSVMTSGGVENVMPNFGESDYWKMHGRGGEDLFTQNVLGPDHGKMAGLQSDGWGMGELWDAAKGGASSAWQFAKDNPELTMFGVSGLAQYGDAAINRKREKDRRKKQRKRGKKAGYQGLASWEVDPYRYARIG